jgi:hypothetical protein
MRMFLASCIELKLALLDDVRTYPVSIPLMSSSQESRVPNKALVASLSRALAALVLDFLLY